MNERFWMDWEKQEATMKRKLMHTKKIFESIEQYVFYDKKFKELY